MANKTDRHRTDRYMTARDLGERLLPDLRMNEFILWAPDLFAFTSYILSHTGAYQLVISPPRGRKWYPRNYEIRNWFNKTKVSEILDLWFENVCNEWSFKGNKKTLLTLLKDNIEKDYKKIEHYFEIDSASGWRDLVKEISDNWKKRLKTVKNDDLKIIDAVLKLQEDFSNDEFEQASREREKSLLELILKHVPPLLIACWAGFYNEISGLNIDNVLTPEERNPMAICDLLCNMEDEIDDNKWNLSELLLTMHAIADLTCLGWGIRTPDPGEESNSQEYAEDLLFKKGSLSTINPQRCRIMPKRHNPELGITLRSVSGNLAFHRSSVDVVWRKAKNNPLVERLSNKKNKEKEKISVLLIPYPFNIETKDFSEDSDNTVLEFPTDESGLAKYGFFKYEPNDTSFDSIQKIIEKANKELPERDANETINPKNVDIVIFPETSLSEKQERQLTEGHDSVLERLARKGQVTSLVVAGVREDKDSSGNFSRNVVYCKYYDRDGNKNRTPAVPPGYGQLGVKLTDKNPKYKQHKHHRWKLTQSQIKQFGLSLVLDHQKVWWEATKVPRRRVSFLNIGEKMTICSLICEDLARQDPIADLMRHVGPSLVITILMDGPQTRNRWASRYATVLSDDPGSSVITLTSFGMVRRYNSPYNEMSRVVAMWSEKDSIAREIELAQGARGILLTIEIESEKERTADGREEAVPTSVLRLLDVIQIYLD
ncbi:MAG TPA: hypothetical protein VNB22_15970 [Pyrinomonadaceae bacterium]|nr:hypothetical protein [Pyrinomonadaceae bacterium]